MNEQQKELLKNICLIDEKLLKRQINSLYKVLNNKSDKSTENYFLGIINLLEHLSDWLYFNQDEIKLSKEKK